MRALLIALVALAGCEKPPPAEPTPPSPDAGPLAVTDAYAPAAPAGGTSALFFTISGGPDADTLRSVAFAGAERTDVHETYDAGDGLRGMRPVAGVPVAAGGETAFAPGSYHVMLVNLARALAPGDTLRAEATFARAGPVPVVAVVRTLDDLPVP